MMQVVALFEGMGMSAVDVDLLVHGAGPVVCLWLLVFQFFVMRPRLILHGMSVSSEEEIHLIFLEDGEELSLEQLSVMMVRSSRPNRPVDGHGCPDDSFLLHLGKLCLDPVIMLFDLLVTWHIKILTL